MRVKKFKNLGLHFNYLVKKNPNKIIIKYSEKERYTFKELDNLSDKIIQIFIKLNIKPRHIIAIESDKNFYSFGLIIACLKYSVTYSFFDISEHNDRVKKNLEILKPNKIFTFKKRNLKNEFILNKNFENKILFKSKTIKKINFSNAIAYIMFTSGSTGVPKGVKISHSNLKYLIPWIKNYFKINNNSIISNLNPLHFDNSVFDIYGSIFNNACLIPFYKKEIMYPKNIFTKIKKTKCDTWFSVPSLLNYILQIENPKIFLNLKLKNIIFGGERFPINSVKKILKYLNKTKIFNVSGPTECTCICSSHQVNKNEILKSKNISIGKINDYFDYKIIFKDKSKKKSNIGELFLEGPAVSAGYHNHKNAEKSKFYKINSHFGYKTGDLVQKLNNKKLKIVGRADNQIKFMGYRIELEEIENNIIKLLNIKDCLVLLRKINSYPYSRLVCYLNKKDGKTTNMIYLLKNLKKKLPYYMIPKKIEYVDKFKYNQNGKIDRAFYKEQL